MADRGLGVSAIAAEIGVTYGAVYKALHPERAREYNRKTEARPERKVAKRIWSREQRVVCSDCGREAGTYSKYKGVLRCQECENARRRRKRARRAHRIETWWAEGLTLREIAERLGTSKNAVGVTIHGLRAEGFDLPYRRPGYVRARIRAGQERKAA
jgi:ribosomal protein S27E